MGNCFSFIFWSVYMFGKFGLHVLNILHFNLSYMLQVFSPIFAFNFTYGKFLVADVDVFYLECFHVQVTK